MRCVKIQELKMKHEVEMKSRVIKQKQEFNKSKSNGNLSIAQKSKSCDQEPDILKEDLISLEEERNRLKSLQSLMKV